MFGLTKHGAGLSNGLRSVNSVISQHGHTGCDSEETDDALKKVLETLDKQPNVEKQPQRRSPHEVRFGA